MELWYAIWLFFILENVRGKMKIMINFHIIDDFFVEWRIWWLIESNELYVWDDLALPFTTRLSKQNKAFATLWKRYETFETDFSQFWYEQVPEGVSEWYFREYFYPVLAIKRIWEYSYRRTIPLKVINSRDIWDVTIVAYQQRDTEAY
jgi:hypothetical protein